MVESTSSWSRFLERPQQSLTPHLTPLQEPWERQPFT